LISGAFGKVKKALKKLKTWAKGKLSGFKQSIQKLHDNFKIAIFFLAILKLLDQNERDTTGHRTRRKETRTNPER
jgi:hypothetical protein